MDRHDTERRLFIAAASLSLLPLDTLAQGGEIRGDAGAANLRPADVGAVHNRAIETLDKVLGGLAPASREGLKRIIGWLAQMKLISSSDAETLGQIVDAVFDGKQIADMHKRVQSFFDKLKEKGSAAAVAIASVARSSIEYFMQAVKDADIGRVIVCVAADISGAATGAGTMMAISALVPPLAALVPWLALAGAVSSSGQAIYATRPK